MSSSTKNGSGCRSSCSSCSRCAYVLWRLCLSAQPSCSRTVSLPALFATCGPNEGGVGILQGHSGGALGFCLIPCAIYVQGSRFGACVPRSNCSSMPFAMLYGCCAVRLLRGIIARRMLHPHNARRLTGDQLRAMTLVATTLPVCWAWLVRCGPLASGAPQPGVRMRGYAGALCGHGGGLVLYERFC